ncbi:hypothetical protein CLHUN_22230 [Ruminiclostridium hungatei]|uniref:Uncharacterized protein n=1 Tax=Ruminiclostridium hungatei TaxID=48256 RepID=A0A1V4SJE1_RUMHU|nr:hypothetical protein [Ruminiclostridium hungatei]OPX43980.1 hypothetical protein CLHUN_22230 [Ruminiclostridium hungatei]
MTAKAGTTALFLGIIELMKNKIYRANYDTGKRNVQLKIDEIFAENELADSCLKNWQLNDGKRRILLNRKVVFQAAL